MRSIVIVDLHRRHAAARREIQPHRGAVGIRDVALARHADALHAGGRAQLQRGLHRTRGVGRPVADLPRAEIQKPAPVVRRVVRAVGAHRSAAQPCLPVERPRHGRFGRLLSACPWDACPAWSKCALRSHRRSRPTRRSPPPRGCTRARSPGCPSAWPLCISPPLPSAGALPTASASAASPRRRACRAACRPAPPWRA